MISTPKHPSNRQSSGLSIVGRGQACHTNDSPVVQWLYEARTKPLSGSIPFVSRILLNFNLKQPGGVGSKQQFAAVQHKTKPVYAQQQVVNKKNTYYEQALNIYGSGTYRCRAPPGKLRREITPTTYDP